MRQATRAQWIKCAIAILLYLVFLIWVRSWWGLIVIPFIFDIYITKKIPWSFWKRSKNPAVRSVMSWVDAIIFALVAVYFVNIYIFQNYQIPSSSLEKSLLVGDFLYVSKMSYGPRVPNTPLSMPLAQHTLPVFNTKSYIEWPQWEYKRVPGFGKVKLNDIVVFNFPAGDTVATNFQQTDFYTLAYEEGKRAYPNKVNMDSLTRKQQRTVYDLYYNAGRNLIRSNPRMYGDIVIRPVDRRENYVKRCVGLPGDTLQIKKGQVYIDGKAIENPTEMQFNYFVQTTGPYITDDMFRELGISKEDQTLMTDGLGWEENLIGPPGCPGQAGTGLSSSAHQKDVRDPYGQQETHQQDYHRAGRVLGTDVSAEPLHQMGPQQLRSDMDSCQRRHHQADRGQPSHLRTLHRCLRRQQTGSQGRRHLHQR